MNPQKVDRNPQKVDRKHKNVPIYIQFFGSKSRQNGTVQIGNGSLTQQDIKRFAISNNLGSKNPYTVILTPGAIPSTYIILEESSVYPVIQNLIRDITREELSGPVIFHSEPGCNFGVGPECPHRMTLSLKCGI